MSDKPILTDREHAALQYLSGMMEATAVMIGQYVAKTLDAPCRNHGLLGGSICGKLRKRGFVMRVPELNAWQITVAGREAL